MEIVSPTLNSQGTLLWDENSSGTEKSIVVKAMKLFGSYIKLVREVFFFCGAICIEFGNKNEGL